MKGKRWTRRKQKAAAAAVIEERLPDLVSLSHSVHSPPELCFQEFQSAHAVATTLPRPAASTSTESAASSRRRWSRAPESGDLEVTACAEYDALPDVGHACGHNIIATSSLGAALALAAVADDLSLQVDPSRHSLRRGWRLKIDLLNAGYFDGEDMALMVHPFASERLPDAICLAVDHFDVIFTGKEAHASAAPWLGINAA